MDTLSRLEEQAIDAAVSLQWEKAIEYNKQILEQEKHNTSALLRLGFAYLQSKHIEDSKNIYEQLLTIQPKHHIARENLERVKILLQKKKGTPDTDTSEQAEELDPNMFLEIPGKTKIVILVHLGQKDHIAGLSVGQRLELKNKKRKVEVRTRSGTFIGYIPDDLSKRLIYFLNEGSIYRTYVKEASLTRVVIFIKEEEKGKKVQHLFSFPQNLHTNIPQGTNAERTDSDEASEDEDEDVLEDESNTEPTEVDKDLLRYRSSAGGDDEEDSDE